MINVAPVGILNELNASIDDLRRQGPVVWDECQLSWIVTGYEECLSILGNDDVFTKGDRFREGGSEFWFGRDLPVLYGREHRRLHSLRLRQTNQKFVDGIASNTITHVAKQLAEDIRRQGHANLVTAFTDKLPFLVGCTYMGFDIHDDELVQKLTDLREIRDRWKDVLLSGSGVAVDTLVAVAGADAVNAMAAAFMPTIRARKAAPRDDVLSALWRDGPSVFDDWGEKDMVAACWSNFDGGESKLFLRNILYLLVESPELTAGLKAQDVKIDDFVEEGLRLLGPTWSTPRLAMRDVKLAGAQIKEGDIVQLMLAVANRDCARWERPDQFVLGRSDRQPLAFGQGPRYCVGRYLARSEATEAVRALVSNLDGIRLDTTCDPPTWHGSHTRSVVPIHVVV